MSGDGGGGCVLEAAPQELVCLRTLLADVDLIQELAQRSEFLRTQVECNGDAGSVKVPVWAGKLWVRCLLKTPATLRATDDATLVKFLKVRIVLSICCMPASSWRAVELPWTSSNAALSIELSICCKSIHTSERNEQIEYKESV